MVVGAKIIKQPEKWRELEPSRGGPENPEERALEADNAEGRGYL